MNEEEKIGKRLLILMFISCMVMVAVLIIVITVNSPKSLVSIPEYESSESETEENNSPENLSEEQSSVTETDEGKFPIGINTADSEELQLIPNIGPSTAKLILDYRNEHGTILSFEELLSISGIGEKTVEILKEYCIIN